jgi:uncharacterized protein (TIGR00299 family) protein
MKTLYLDIFSGISGDMFLGAMLDLGLDLHYLTHQLAKLNLPGYHLHATRSRQSSIEGVKFDVHLEGDHGHLHAHDDPHDHGHQHASECEPLHGHGHHAHGHAQRHEHEHEHSRDFAKIKQLIEQSALSDWVKSRSMSVFHRVAVAEGKIHGQRPESVHFHEVGAVDSIVDIVGACIALETLGQPRVLAAPVVDGTGWVDCAHGRFPIPTTATLEILGARGVSVTQCDEPHELVTPTGAALLAEFAESFGPMQELVAERIGYGLGTRQNKTRPNVLRAILGESKTSPVDATQPHDWELDTISAVETNLDDCSAEVLGYFVEQALAAGALDVFHTPIQMKKNRPGVLLTVLCTPADADKFSALMLRETSAFGIRRYTLERRKLRRHSTTVRTPYGDISVKLGMLDGKVVQAAPEFESCRTLALQCKVPLAEIYRAAERAAAGSGVKAKEGER